MASHNLTFDLEELFTDDFLSLDSKSSIPSSIFDESWSIDSMSGEISNAPSPASYQNSESYTIIQPRTRWEDDRLEWVNLVDQGDDGKFKCPKCSRFYTRKSNLKAHFASVHAGIKRFECSGCSKQFVRRSYVKQHQRICKKLS